MKLPNGYVEVRRGSVRGFALEAAADWLRATLAQGETLREWAASRTAGGFRGRGTVYAVSAPIPGPEGAVRWAIRHYRRGGAVEPLLGDRFSRLGASRPHAELLAAETARARGVPTPAVVAGVLYPAGPFYRADLVTEVVEGSVDLAAYLFGEQGSAALWEAERTDARRAALKAAGGLVALLERSRVEHRDLNAMNVLLQANREGMAAWVVDLDRCTTRAMVAPPAGPRMRRRLVRSLKKLGRTAGRPLATTEWDALSAGLGARV